MKPGKNGQISTEYLIIVGFVTFLVISLLGLAFFYISDIRDNLKMNQINSFGKKIVNSAESVYFSGIPSRATITVYLPKGVTDISVDTSQRYLIIGIETDSGLNIISFPSRVPISLNPINPINTVDGMKRIQMEANVDGVVIKQV